MVFIPRSKIERLAQHKPKPGPCAPVTFEGSGQMVPDAEGSFWVWPSDPQIADSWADLKMERYHARS